MGNLLIRFLVTGLLIGLSASPSLPVCNLEPIHCLIFNAGEQHGCMQCVPDPPDAEL